MLMLSDHVATECRWRDLYELRRVGRPDPAHTRSMNVKVIYATRWSLKLAGKRHEREKPSHLKLCGVLDKLVKTPITF